MSQKRIIFKTVASDKVIAFTPHTETKGHIHSKQKVKKNKQRKVPPTQKENNEILKGS